MMLMRYWCTLVLFTGLLAAGTAHAEQPVFSEMPRWNDGWGVQLLQEYRRHRFLHEGQQPLADGARYAEDAHLMHLQGVYTWTKSVRLTLKVPYVLDARRTVPDDQGGVVSQRDRGFGDPTIALPLKSYFNLDGRSGSWTIAPQLKVPVAGHDEYDVYHRVWVTGLGFGYETETYRYHIGTGTTVWYHPQGDPTKFDTNLSLGINVQFLGGSGHLKWKTIAKYETDGTFALSAGPTFYWRFTDFWHGQVRWQHGFYDHRPSGGFESGDSFRVGVGVVY